MNLRTSFYGAFGRKWYVQAFSERFEINLMVHLQERATAHGREKIGAQYENETALR